MKPIEKLSFLMVGIGLVFVSLAVIRLNEHVDALEQTQKAVHYWIVNDNGGFTSNEVFKAISIPKPKD